MDRPCACERVRVSTLTRYIFPSSVSARVAPGKLLGWMFFLSLGVVVHRDGGHPGGGECNHGTEYCTMALYFFEGHSTFWYMFLIYIYTCIYI
jgi:hypothetical protein